MIEKLLRIENIGPFAQCGGDGAELNLRPLTLIYAENGRGKTTFCAVLRSLASGRPEYILERARLGGT